jgi:methylmalonyl-CoA mutase N-terminal domain/subunit
MPAWTSRDDITEFGVSHTESGIPVRLSYPPGETSPLPPPGEFPYARGLRADGYRTRPWTFRQYAGFAGGTETNERLRYLVANGQSGLSIALDLPTQMGLDSDDPRAKYEVGRLGVAIDCLADMEALYDGIPIESISSSFTINATALVILAFYVAMADRRGTPREKLSGTVQNDMLKEFVARGAYMYPPAHSVRLCTDLNGIPLASPQLICGRQALPRSCRTDSCSRTPSPTARPYLTAASPSTISRRSCRS